MRHLVMCLVLVGSVLVTSADAGIFGGRRSRGYSTGSTTASRAESVEKYKGPSESHEEALLKKINEQRKRYGLKALVLDPLVQARARRHCSWMARNHSMVHSADGAENIAMGYGTIDSAVNGWMNSSGHRANILGNYRTTGVAKYTSPSGTVFWCQQFK